jgi:hypothetical protein
VTLPSVGAGRSADLAATLKDRSGGRGTGQGDPVRRQRLLPGKGTTVLVDAAPIEQGPLFRRISRWGVLGEVALHEGSVNTILAARAKAAGLLYVPEMSSHSLRRGLATSAHRAGADFLEIKRQGG